MNAVTYNSEPKIFVEELVQDAIKTLSDKRLNSVLVEINPSSKVSYESIINILNSCGLKLQKKGIVQASKSVNHIFYRQTK